MLLQTENFHVSTRLDGNRVKLRVAFKDGTFSNVDMTMDEARIIGKDLVSKGKGIPNNEM